MLSCQFIAALWSPAGKGLTSWLPLCVMFMCFCYFPVWCPVSGVVLDCIDFCSLPSYLLFKFLTLTFGDNFFVSVLCKFLLMYICERHSICCQSPPCAVFSSVKYSKC